MTFRTKSEKHSVLAYQRGVFLPGEAVVASEYPLTLFVNDMEFATIVCTPDDLEALIVGFMASEGVLSDYREIAGIDIDADNGIAYVRLPGRTIDPGLLTRRRISSCCGKSRQSFYFMNDAATAKKVQSELAATPEQITDLMGKLAGRSDLHRLTGGVHNAALCTPDNVLLQTADIGRHNALDKIYGACLMRGLPTGDKIVAISGRISSEMLLKAAKIGCPLLLSKSAPTGLALRLAEELGITAVGFAREGGFNVYTHHRRIIGT